MTLATEAFGKLCGLGLGGQAPFSGLPQMLLSRRAWMGKLTLEGRLFPGRGKGPALHTSLEERC